MRGWETIAELKGVEPYQGVLEGSVGASRGQQGGGRRGSGRQKSDERRVEWKRQRKMKLGAMVTRTRRSSTKEGGLSWVGRGAKELRTSQLRQGEESFT